MAQGGISLLGYALLGLLQKKPSSGYDLRKVFTATPMGAFSDSPGAIYPALRRLQRGGFIVAHIEGSGLRRRRVFRLTAAGLGRLRKWLNAQVSRDDVVHRMDALLLRFSFMEFVVGKKTTVRFLLDLQGELNSYVVDLRQYFQAQRRLMPRSGWLALESGIRGYEAQFHWAGYALKAYEQKTKAGNR